MPHTRLPTTVACLVALLLASNGATAQEKHRARFSSGATDSEYTQQHAIDIGDAPGHQLRIYELHRSYGKQGAVLIDGVALQEAWIRAVSDYTDLNGLGSAYVTYVMANGDKIYGRANFVAQKKSGGAEGGEEAAGAGGAGGGLKNLTVVAITGGTGRFARIRGIVKAETIADPVAGINENKSEIEYWLEP